MYGPKLRAGALQLTIFIVVVIALLLMGFILFMHTHKHFDSQSDFIIETVKNSNRGIDYALSNDLKLNDTTQIELNNSEFKTIKVNKEFWGVFEKVTSVSKIKKNVIKKTAIIGGVQKEKDRTALYLQDNNLPLVVVGNTMIKGASYLPEKGVKSGTISGQSYYGSQLVYGNKKISNLLPELYSETTDQINKLNDQYLNAKPEQFLNVIAENTYSNSFFEPVQFVYSNNEIKLASIQLIGHVIIQSKTKIIVENSSVLKDVILLAPEIEIQNGVIGCFQAFATQYLTVGKNVTLDYPTVLVLNEKKIKLLNTLENNKKSSKLFINSNSIIKGSILYFGQPKPNNDESQIELKKNTTVFGELYCNQNIDLKGTVFGTVYTNNFITKQSHSIYQNHIYNGRIIIDQLSPKYVGIRLLNYKKSIVKWLN